MSVDPGGCDNVFANLTSNLFFKVINLMIFQTSSAGKSCPTLTLVECPVCVLLQPMSKGNVHFKHWQCVWKISHLVKLLWLIKVLPQCLHLHVILFFSCLLTWSFMYCFSIILLQIWHFSFGKCDCMWVLNEATYLRQIVHCTGAWVTLCLLTSFL